MGVLSTSGLESDKRLNHPLQGALTVRSPHLKVKQKRFIPSSNSIFDLKQMQCKHALISPLISCLYIVAPKEKKLTLQGVAQHLYLRTFFCGSKS